MTGIGIHANAADQFGGDISGVAEMIGVPFHILPGWDGIKLVANKSYLGLINFRFGIFRESRPYSGFHRGNDVFSNYGFATRTQRSQNQQDNAEGEFY